MSGFSDWFQSVFKNLFSTGSTGTVNNTSKRNRVSPSSKDLSFPDTVNVELTRGLWHNSIVGYKLGAGLCYNPIKIPLTFMGVPHFDLLDKKKRGVSNYDFWIDRIKYYNENCIKAKQDIQLECHRDGTSIIWPWFDSGKGYVRWKHIKPETVYKYIVDPDTNDLKALITKETITYYRENGELSIYSEQKTYTEQKIIISRSGSPPENINKSEIKRNPVKMLPIVFANNRESGEIEGNSDYERIISYIKAYSEINKSAHETLINIGPKLVQYASDIDKWLAQNGYDSTSDVDISTVDFIGNVYEKEKTEFIIPQKIIDGHLSLMKNGFINMVEATGIPEIVWGVKMQGNHASAQEQMGVLLSFVDDKQRQAEVPYYQLMRATLLLEAIANTQKAPENIIISWNDLDSLNEVERSEIFKNWSDGLAKLLEYKSIDLQSAHNLLFNLTNGKITANYEDFKEGIKEYGTLYAFLEQEYFDIRSTREQAGETTNNKNNWNGHDKKLAGGILI